MAESPQIHQITLERGPLSHEFSYANRVLKAELQRFLDLVCKGAKRPAAKLFFDLVYGVMRSGSTLVSMVARSLCEESPIDTAEHRLTRGMEAEPPPIESSLADFAIGMSAGDDEYERKMKLMSNCCSYLRHCFESHNGIKFAKLEAYGNFFLYHWSHVRK